MPTQIPSNHVPIINYCISWGDPHIVQFIDVVDGEAIRLSYSSMEGGDFILFKVGEYAIWQRQVQYNSSRIGVYANTENMYVKHQDTIIASKGCPICGVRVTNSALVTANNIETTSKEYWPTSIHPGRFETMLLFTEYPDLRVFIRGYDNPTLVT
jgi:hypothetical protein